MSTVLRMRGRSLLGASLALAGVVGCRANFDSVPDAQPDANPVFHGCELWLTMDELAWQGRPGEVLDVCGMNDPGVAIGGITTDTDAVRGRVGLFSGAGYVSVPDSVRLRGGGPGRTLTVAAWVRPLAPVGQPPAGIVAKRTSFGVKSAYTMFLWTGGHMWSDIDAENDRVDVPAPIAADRWTHLAVVYDGGAPRPKRIRTYQDGVPTGQWTESSSEIPMDFDSPVTVGYLPDMQDPNLTFRGHLDDIVVWSRALDDDEIAAWHAMTRR